MNETLYLHTSTDPVTSDFALSDQTSAEGSPLYTYAGTGDVPAGWKRYDVPAVAETATFAASTDPAAAPIAAHRDVVEATEIPARDDANTTSMPVNPTALPEPDPESAVTPAPHAATLASDESAAVELGEKYAPAITSDVEDLIRDIHAKVTEVHGIITDLSAQLPEFAKAMESGPLGKMFGGLFNSNK